MEELLYLDELTGVRNRRYLSKVKEELIPELQSKEIPFTIVITDLDHFKDINDTYGHLMGDKAIRFFADFLKSNLREKDIIVRYGGDEFVVLQEGLLREDAYVIWGRLIEKLKSVEFNELKLSMSVGIASYPTDGDRFSVLFESADTSLYQAKRAGRGRVGIKSKKSIRIPAVKFIDRMEVKDRLFRNVENGIITVVQGEAGIGKTRLIKEALSRLKGVEILWSDCMALDRKIAYYPLRELLKYKISRQENDVVERIPKAYRIEIGKIVPEVIRGISKEELESYGEELDRYRLYEGFNAVFNLGNRRKILVIDNIQWIDEESIEALKYIINTNKSDNFTFIFAMRTEENLHYSEEFLRDIGRTHKVVETINLSPLKESHVREVVSEIIGEEQEELEKYIVRESGGNVFYIEELIRALDENSYLKVVGDNWVFKEPETSLTPRGIEDVVERKFNRLSNDARELLGILSVAKKGYIEMLIDISGFNEGQVFGLIDEGMRAGLITEDEEEELVRYKNEITREVIYSKVMGGLRKRKLHKKVAEWMENNRREGNEEELLYHYRMARSTEKIVEYGIRAGDIARSLYANNDALRYYAYAEKALKSTESEDRDRKLVELYIKMSEVMDHVGRYEDALKISETAIKIAESKDMYPEVVELFDRKFWAYKNTGRMKEALSVGKEFLKLCEEKEITDRMWKAYDNLGNIYRSFGELEKSLDFFEKALNVIDTENPETEAEILNDMAGSYYYMGKYDKSLEYLNRAQEIYRKYEIKKGVASILDNTGLVYSAIAQFGKALEYYFEALEVVREIGYIFSEANIYNNIGATYVNLGEFDKAEKYLKKGMQIAESIGHRNLLGNVYNNIALVYQAEVKLDEALLYFKKSYEVAEQAGSRVNMVIGGVNIANVLLLMDRYEDAISLLDRIHKIAVELETPHLILMVLNAQIDTLLEIEDYKSAGEKIEEGFEVLSNNEVKHAEKLDFLINALAYFTAVSEDEQIKDILRKIEGLIRDINHPAGKIDYYFAMMDYLIEKNDIRLADEYLAKTSKALKDYPDKLKTAYYSFYAYQLACLEKKENVREYLEKSREQFKTIGLSHKFDKLIKNTGCNW